MTTDIIKRLRDRLASWRDSGATGLWVNFLDLAALIDRLDAAERENERLREWEACAREWLSKTEWVQTKDLLPKYLGWHRADIMRDEIDKLRKELAHEEQRVADMMADVNRVGHENEQLRRMAQRIPLSDDEINALIEEKEPYSVLAIARIVEQAHGIRGKK